MAAVSHRGLPILNLSLPGWAHGLNSSTAAAAAAAEKLEDPESEDEGGVLLVGPGVVSSHLLVGNTHDRLGLNASVVGVECDESAQLALLAEADDGADDDEDEVEAAEAAAAEATDKSGGSLVSTDADDDHVDDEEDHEGSHHGVHDGPSGACLSAVSVAFREFSEFLLFFAIFINVGDVLCLLWVIRVREKALKVVGDNIFLHDCLLISSLVV